MERRFTGPGAQAESTREARDPGAKEPNTPRRDRNRNVENSIAPALDRPRERETTEKDHQQPPNEVKRRPALRRKPCRVNITTRYVQVDTNITSRITAHSVHGQHDKAYYPP